MVFCPNALGCHKKGPIRWDHADVVIGINLVKYNPCVGLTSFGVNKNIVAAK